MKNEERKRAVERAEAYNHIAVNGLGEINLNDGSLASDSDIGFENSVLLTMGLLLSRNVLQYEEAMQAVDNQKAILLEVLGFLNYISNSLKGPHFYRCIEIIENIKESLPEDQSKEESVRFLQNFAKEMKPLDKDLNDAIFYDVEKLY